MIKALTTIINESNKLLYFLVLTSLTMFWSNSALSKPDINIYVFIDNSVSSDKGWYIIFFCLYYLFLNNNVVDHNEIYLM